MNNIPASVQMMAWRRPGDNPLSEPMLVNLLTQICVTRPQCVDIYYAITEIHVQMIQHKDDMTRKRFLYHWPFEKGIWSPVQSFLKGPILRSFDVFLVARLNKLGNKRFTCQQSKDNK